MFNTISLPLSNLNIEQLYFRTNTPCHQYESFSRMMTQKSVSISTVMDASVIIEPYNIWLSKETNWQQARDIPPHSSIGLRSCHIVSVKILHH